MTLDARQFLADHYYHSDDQILKNFIIRVCEELEVLERRIAHDEPANVKDEVKAQSAEISQLLERMNEIERQLRPKSPTEPVQVVCYCGAKLALGERCRVCLR